MTLVRRHDAAPPLGAIFGAVLLTCAGLAWGWLRLGLPLPGCPFRALTGLPCPTCGTTHLVQALLAGDVLGALAHNPFVFACGVALAGWSVASAAGLVAGHRVSVVLAPREATALRVTVVVLVILDWAWLMATRQP